MQNAERIAEACRGSRRLCLLASVLAGVVLFAVSAPADAKKAARKPTLEEALRDNAPRILDSLWKNTSHPKESLHVGALKFLVQLGDGPASDNAGPLNLLLADRLEAALILSLDDSSPRKIRILHNPNAALMMKANHLTAAGRAAFFRMRYSPAWGRDETEKLSADAFLTGLVKIADGGRSAEITVQAFDKKSKELVEVCPKFKIAGDRSLLTEAGVSFALPRGEDGAKLVAAWGERDEVPTEAKTSVVSDKRPSVTPRELLEQAPIEWQILYNGKPMDVSDDGRVREPTKKDEVTFRLRHKNLDANTYGAILKVNGKNTILPDNPEPDDYLHYKWILAPKAGFLVQGFQTDLEQKAHKFEVQSLEASREREVSYGPHAGTFTLVIFKGRQDGKESRLARSDDDAPVIGRGVPQSLAGSINLKSLQGKLRAQAQTQPDSKAVDRGLIVPGARTEQEVTKMEFKAYPNPVSVIHIRYYKPRNSESAGE